jgi:vanillate O-demethylase ferredoxin subunit
MSSLFPPSNDKPITVHLARTGRTVIVDPGVSILDALLMEGIDVPSSCLQGVCGTCETAVIAGVPEHRDEILTSAERAANKTMMICCSRASTETLTLDL